MLDGKALNDHDVASELAREVGDELVDLQQRARHAGHLGWALEVEGDQLAHEILVARLQEHRPDDAVLSEEGADHPDRLDAERAWIVDPLDGSSGFGEGGSDWAVHVALTRDGRTDAAAVAVPALEAVFSTGSPEMHPSPRDELVVVTGHSRSWTDGVRVATALGAELKTCGSAGVKAMLVVRGVADVYVHAGPLYEWDVCAPVAVAEAVGLAACAPDGSQLVFNQPRPVVPGIVVCRPELLGRVVESLVVAT